MSADTAYQALVIILSVTLAIFLILAIILVTKLIKISDDVKHITEKTEEIVDRAENVSSFFERSAPSMFIGRFISSFFDSSKSTGGRKRRDNDDE